MILSGPTKFRIGKVAGLLLLLVAVGVLPLAARVRADDEPNQENAATQLNTEKGEQLVDDVWERLLRARAKYAKSGNEAAKRREAVERATQGLRNLGFDERLIETLMEDREKAQSVVKAIETILSPFKPDRPRTSGRPAGRGPKSAEMTIVDDQLPRLADAELAVMQLLWDHEQLTAGEIREQLYPDETTSNHGTVQRHGHHQRGLKMRWATIST